jgi:Ca2+-transporting ATPase
MPGAHRSDIDLERPPAARAQWHAIPAREACSRLEVDPALGLENQEAQWRLLQFGPNRLRQVRNEPLWWRFLEELREPMVLLLLVTGLLYAVWGSPADAVTIFFVILTLTGIEVFNEQRARLAIAALHRLAEPTASVRRQGRMREVPAAELVVGDIIALRAGRRVPADAHLIDGFSLAVDESSLTGESVPAEKDPGQVLADDAPMADRLNLVFAGTTVVRGSATAVVVATGMDTQLGRVAALATETSPPRTPLQHAMRDLSRMLVWLAVGFSVAVPLLGWLLTDQSLHELVLTGLSLAFATIPEEMPIIITMVLALGGYRLSRQHAIVRRLQAVETLGAITVIATDKTGTLTENRMKVAGLYPENMRARLLQVGALCNDADQSDGAWTGDPLDAALLEAASAEGLDAGALRASHPKLTEFTFDNERKMMSAVFDRDGVTWAAVKGAPERVLAISTHERRDATQVFLDHGRREEIQAQAARMAERGLRVIGMAEKGLTNSRQSRPDVERDLDFIGLVGFSDPPRPGVMQAISDCQTAAVRPVMITGDHPLTARAVASQIGLGGDIRMTTGRELDALSDAQLEARVKEVSVFARTTPEHKLRIVRALQGLGERVALTGDGVNDGPALVAADVGVALGETGTDVAREASDIILADDNFTTIVRAIGEGRALFANLKKGVRYYLACKVALISAIMLPILLSAPAPFAPIQIILMELFMDLAAAATFVAEPAEYDLMQQPPRDPRRRFMDGAMVGSIVTSAAGLFAAVSAVFLMAWYSSGDLTVARTAAFTTWLLGHVLLAFNLRTDREPFIRTGPFANRRMVGWSAATLAFVVAATMIPGAHALFKTTNLPLEEWGLLVAAALLGTFWLEVRKMMKMRTRARESAQMRAGTKARGSLPWEGER